jgi:hypothetical protein
MLFVAGSCTYDYFEDETNFRLYVPQIERDEISRFYVSFHRLDGRDAGEHVITREVSAPFDDNESLRQGIMKFKLPPGRYEISTFADYDAGMISVGEHFDSSRKAVGVYDGGSRGDNVFTTNATQPRALFLRNTQVYPINHPDSERNVEADIDEDYLFKSHVLCRFIGLPRTITRAVVTYHGLATRYDFDGVFRLFSDGDQYFQQHDFVNTTGEDVVVADLIYPSAGVGHDAHDGHIDDGREIELEIDFYAGDSWAGEASFSSADLAGLAPGNTPTRNGEPVTDKRVLYPRDQVEFVFKDWLIFSIGLTPWGEIGGGGVIIH